MPLPRPLGRIARHPLSLGAALFILSIAVFIPAMSGDFIWDDDITLTSNALVKLPFTEGLKNIWFSRLPTDYYPVTWSTFWMEWRAFALDPAGYHVVNILLHALSAVLLWRILLRLGLPGGAATAWCAGLLFAVHPMGVDSVAWISQRKNTLSMALYLASILGYLRFVDGGAARSYWLSLFFFAAALLAKSSVIALPLMLICLLWYREGDAFLRSLVRDVPPFGRATRKRRAMASHPLVRLAPFFVLSAGSAYLTLWFQGKVLGYGLTSGNDPSNIISKAIGASLKGETNLGERLLVVGQAYWFYIGKLFFPKGIAMVYGGWEVNAGHIAHYVPLLLLAGALLAAFLLRGKIGRGLCAGLSAIAISLLPVLGLVKMSYQAYSWVANHLGYLAIPPAAALAAAAAARLCARLRAPVSQIAPLAAFAIAAALFAGQTWKRSGFYRHPEDLWRDNILKVPQAHAPYNELGIVLINQRRYEEAVEVLRQCIAIDPTFDKPHNNLGTALSYLGRDEEAIAAFERALHYNSHDPDAMGNLGLMYLRTGNAQKAVDLFVRTLQIRPMSPSTYHNLGLALRNLERDKEATAAFERSVAMNPTSANFRQMLGIQLYETGQYAAALRQLLIALELGKPEIHALNTAAWIMATNQDPALRDGPRALQLITMANNASPHRDVGLLHTTAAALAEVGRFDEAVGVLREATRIVGERGGQPQDFARIESEIQLYQRGQPYREG